MQNHYKQQKIIVITIYRRLRRLMGYTEPIYVHLRKLVQLVFHQTQKRGYYERDMSVLANREM